MRKLTCTGLFRNISFKLSNYVKLNSSINVTSFVSYEGSKYGKLGGLLNRISLGQYDGIVMVSPFGCLVVSSCNFKYGNLDVTLVRKPLGQ